MLTAGGGTAAWWFLLRDSGSIIDPNMVVPADDWAAGAKRTGSSTIKKDATIAVSPNGSFLVALSKDSSGTGRSSSGATLTGYSLTGGRASESWSVKVEIASIMETYIVFWDNDTIVADGRLYDVATGDHRSAPWKGGRRSSSTTSPSAARAGPAPPGGRTAAGRGASMPPRRRT